MIRNTGPGKRFLAVGIVLILGMTGCGTDNEIALAGTEVIGIEAMAAEESTELTAIGENVPAGNTESATAGDTEQTDAASGIEGTQGQEAQLSWQEQTTADRMAGRTKVKGIYVTGPKAGSAGMEDLIRLVDETELNAMVIDVKNDEGNLTFRLTNEEIPQDIPVLDRISEMQAGIRYIRDIQTMMQELKDHNIYTIARIVCFKDPILAAAQPELALTKPDGKPVTDANGLAWVNPYRQEVWEYLTELAEMAADLGFDEIQYDYVRFPVGSDADAADYGVDMEAYPKRQAIQDFLSYAGDRLHEKGCVVTADVFGTIIGSETDVQTVGQDYTALGQTVDAISPMVYPSHYANGVFGLKVPDAHPYETVSAAMQGSAEELQEIPEAERAVVRPWLQAFTATWVPGHISYNGTQIREQIQAVYDAGYEEWILWNATNRYSPDGLLAAGEEKQ
uniref:putative glycoside hydrolase n=1 Tax=Waltera acetigignens TaxID=2981769 RepID=UPI003F7CDA30